MYILGLIVILSIALIPRLAAAVDLVVDAGSLTVTGDITYTNEDIGQTGTGELTHTNGTNTATGALTLGRDGGADGSYILRNSGSRLLVGLDEVIGRNGTGIFTQEGGSHAVSGSLYLGYEDAYDTNTFSNVRGVGTFSLTGGDLQVGGNEYIGRSGGGGSFTQSAGTHAVNGILFLGTGFQSLAEGVIQGTGDYTLSGTGQLSSGLEFIGFNGGNGSFTQSGGTHTVAASLNIGYLFLYDPASGCGNSGTGVYTLSGGGLQVSGEFIGSLGGSGVFTQSGGTHNVAQNLLIGYGYDPVYLAYSWGAYTLSGGGLRVGGNEYIGRSGGSGSFTQSGGTHSVTGSLILAADVGGTGSYTLSGGSLTAGVVDLNSGGIFNQTGGSLSVTTFNQQGGEVRGSLENRGTFNYTSGLFSGRLLNYGSVNFNADFIAGNGLANYSTLGIAAGRTITLNGEGLTNDGTMTLSGTLIASDEIIGSSGNGTFTQTGGTNTVAGSLILAANAGSTGIYNLRGGSLAAGVVNLNSGGIFNQAGGSLTVGVVNLNSGGIFNQTGGSLPATTFNQQGGEVQGSLENRGTFNYTSGLFSGRLLNYGTVNLNADFTAGNGLANYSNFGISAGRTVTLNGEGLTNEGTMTLSGTLMASDEIIGSSGNGIFIQTGGTNTVTGSLILAANAGSEGIYNLEGGSLTAGVVNLNSGGIFNQTGGSLSFTTFNQQGGEVRGNLENRGTFNYSGGLFDKRLINYGAVNFYADFTAEDGLTNYSSTPLVINAGRNVTLNGAGLDNLGVLEVNGVLTGSGVNEATGILSGSGTITGNLTNSGRVNPGNSPGTLTISGNYTQTQSGILAIEMASAASYDQLRITGGRAVLDGTLTPILLGGYKPTGQLFRGVVSATDGISGTFGAVGGGLYPTLHWTALYSADSVDLMVQRVYDDPAWGLTRNQQEVGSMLTLFGDSASGDLNTVLNGFDNLTSGPAVRDALQQVSPDKFASLSTLAFAGAAFQAHNISNRINALRFDVPGGGSGGLNFGYSGGQGLTMAFNAGGASNLFSDLDRAMVAQNPGNQLSLSTEPGVALGRQDSTPNQTGFDFTIAGFTAAADWRVRDDLLIGLASGYNHTDASFFGSGGSVDGSTIPFNLYAAYLRGPFYLYGSAGYALNLFDVERDISFGGLARTAKSSITGHQFNGYGETGYDLGVGKAVLTPNFSLSYSHVWFDGFTEHGADALDLTLGDQSAESLQTGLGGRITVPFSVCEVKMVPQMYASWQHELSNDSRILNAGLSQAGSNFTFQTDGPMRDFALAGIALAVKPTRDLWLQINYNTEIGRDDYTVHTINAGLWYGF